MSLHGHVWTIGPWMHAALRPPRVPVATPWNTPVSDPRMGTIVLRGWLRHVQGCRTLLLVVHGIGGDSTSYYMLGAAVAAEQAGLSCLRLNLRGADGTGADIYHAALTDDLAAAVASAAARAYDRIYILGYSLGGHLALRYASEPRDGRVAAVAAICPPLDLDLTATAIDQPKRWVYRRHILSGLKDAYAAVAARRDVAVSVQAARAIRTLREWDGRIVAPRFGFQSAEHYYEQASAARRLGQLAIPALLVATEADPMVPAETLKPALRETSPPLHVRWLPRGGHVGFPGDIHLGFSRSRGFERQVIDWLTGSRDFMV